ncbi:MAG: Crp/Fnr family transcriptional regulator [Chloroflexota bacterium]|nr:Crp/Fnr family transcriptional regulator [Chloroflexota bacterium]
MQPTTMSSSIERGADRRRVTGASLRRIPFFHEVPESVLVPLATVSSRQVLGHGDLLWQPDDALEAIFVLAAGVVRLYRDVDNGQEITVALLDRGQVCGLTGLDDAAFLPTTVAQSLTEETVVYRIPRRDFAAFLRANPAVALRALDSTCRRVRDAYDLLALPDARARVAYVLAHLVRDNGERTVWTTHEELATWARGRREAVTGEVLPDLRERGLIAYERHRRSIRVLDRAGLLALATDGRAHVR